MRGKSVGFEEAACLTLARRAGSSIRHARAAIDVRDKVPLGSLGKPVRHSADSGKGAIINRGAVALSLALLAASAVSRADSVADVQRGIADAKSAWSAHGPSSYEFTVRFHDFVYLYCEAQSFRVTHGHIRVITKSDCRPSRDPRALGTIPKLLAYAKRIAKGPVPSAEFKFDPVLGVPRTFGIWDDSLSDSYSGFEVTSFASIAP